MFHRLSSVTPLLVVALVFQLLAMACGPVDGRLAAPRTAPDKETERPAADGRGSQDRLCGLTPASPPADAQSEGSQQ